jgi:hypothetical protein
MRRSSSRATRKPEIEVSGTPALMGQSPHRCRSLRLRHPWRHHKATPTRSRPTKKSASIAASDGYFRRLCGSLRSETVSKCSRADRALLSDGPSATACGSRDVRRQLILLVDHLVVLGKRRERLPRHHMHHFVAAPFELEKHSGSASAVGPKSARRRRRSRPGLFQCRLYPLRCPILNLGKPIRSRGRGTKKARFFARSHPRKIFPS